MFRNKDNPKFLATLFASVYLFVALFSQNFHEHGSGEVFKDFHFQKTEKTFTSSSEITNYADCLSCHILHEGKYVNLQEFLFSAISESYFKVEIFTAERITVSQTLYNFHVRGPPAFFI